MSKKSIIKNTSILDPLIDLKKFINHFTQICKDFLVGGHKIEDRSSSIECSLIEMLTNERTMVISILNCFDRLLFFLQDNEIDPIIVNPRRDTILAKNTIEWFFNHVYPVVSRFIHQWIDIEDSFLEELPFTIQNIHHKLVSVQQNFPSARYHAFSELARCYNGVNDF